MRKRFILAATENSYSEGGERGLRIKGNVTGTEEKAKVEKNIIKYSCTLYCLLFNLDSTNELIVY